MQLGPGHKVPQHIAQYHASLHVHCTAGHNIAEVKLAIWRNIQLNYVKNHEKLFLTIVISSRHP